MSQRRRIKSNKNIKKPKSWVLGDQSMSDLILLKQKTKITIKYVRVFKEP